LEQHYIMSDLEDEKMNSQINQTKMLPKCKKNIK
jgi:hypothetical protein